MDQRMMPWQTAVLTCVIIMVTSQQTTIHPDCVTETSRLTCSHDLPDHIPNGVNEVYVTDYDHENFTQQKHVFENGTWPFVDKLDIIVNSRRKNFKIYNYDFAQLKDLKVLGVHTPELKRIGPYGLAGLNQLVHLDLTDCLSLKGDKLIIPLTTNNSTARLKSLDLKGLGTMYGRFFNFSTDFMLMIQTKAIERLGVSGTNIQIGDYSFVKNSIQYLDVSNITIFDLSIKSKSRRELMKAVFQNIKTLNASWLPSRFFDASFDLENRNVTINVTKKCYYWPPNLETFDVSHIGNKHEGFFNNATVDYSHCPGKWKTVYLRGNSLKKLNGTVHWPKNASLTEIDLSLNEISYISPKLLNEQRSMKSLHLSNNSLFLMETLPEFGDLLKTFDHLEHFYMAYNDLTFIPYDMFANNTRLTIIDLKGNKFESVTFTLKHQYVLEVLDLRDNRIMYIDGIHLQELKQIDEVDLRGNPLECSCKSLDFITWLESTTTGLACTLEGEVLDLDQTAMEKSDYLCHRTSIILYILVAVGAGILTVVIVTVVTVKIVKRQKSKQAVRKFTIDLKIKKLEEDKLLIL